jgi:uncharacterized membrane protein YhaH (DUF805 family)
MNMPVTAQGRMRRLAYFGWFVLLAALITAGIWLPLVGFGLIGLCAWLMTCIHARRLHDMGATAWWMLAAAAVQAACLALAGIGVAILNADTPPGGTAPVQDPGGYLMAGAVAAWALTTAGFFLVLCFARSSHGDRFGPPLGTRAPVLGGAAPST